MSYESLLGQIGVHGLLKTVSKKSLTIEPVYNQGIHLALPLELHQPLLLSFLLKLQINFLWLAIPFLYFLYGNNAVVKYFLNKIRNFFSKVLFGTKPYNSMSCVKSTAFLRDKKNIYVNKDAFWLILFLKWSFLLNRNL